MITININPIAFLDVRWYGIMVALAIVEIILWMAWQIRKGARISYDTLFSAAVVGIPSGVIVSRLLHVLDRWDYYSKNLGQIIGGSGLTIYGAILGATLGIWIYGRFSKLQFGYFADLLAPAVILAQVIGRIGCTINGCCYGLPTSLPWGCVYVNPDSYAPLGIAVHPTQVYEIIYLLIIFIVVLRLKDRLQPEGSLFLVYLGLYSLWRLGIDFLREGTPFLFGLHQAQVIAIIVLVVVIFQLVYRIHRIKPASGVNEPASITGEPDSTLKLDSSAGESDSNERKTDIGADK
ncbi:MAG: prolipoprotein diacylglyceryl transferase [Dehalococcoidales bacterium]|nr:prolipoprotein diacylglyceryl transferase [Dehalococcoidales bacterium]